jgi:hypothetical protein
MIIFSFQINTMLKEKIRKKNQKTKCKKPKDKKIIIL